MPKLTDTYTLLRAQAAAKQGAWRSATLARGAGLGVRIDNDRITVQFTRQHKRLGDVELSTFRAHCQIPAEARRDPPEPDQQFIDEQRDLFYVRYSWPLTD